MRPEEFLDVNKLNITLVAALIAAFASIGNVYFSHLSSTSLEERKWQKQQENEAQRNLTVAFADYSRELATGIHEAVWLLWIAQNSPSLFSEKDFGAYNRRIKEVLPRLMASNVLLAAHDYSIYKQSRSITQDFYTLDANIALSAAEFKKSRKSGLKHFQKLYWEAQSLNASIPKKLSDIIKQPSDGRK